MVGTFVPTIIFILFFQMGMTAYLGTVNVTTTGTVPQRDLSPKILQKNLHGAGHFTGKVGIVFSVAEGPDPFFKPPLPCFDGQHLLQLTGIHVTITVFMDNVVHLTARRLLAFQLLLSRISKDQHCRREHIGRQ